MNENTEKLTIKRILIYVMGILFVSLGIVLCKKCGMGISPISSIPFVLMYITPLTFGTLTTLFHLINTLLQMLMTRKFSDIKLWLQIPLGFVFGLVIDFFNTLITIDDTVLMYRIFALIFSIFFTALGMVCMLGMNLIQNPPDGTVKQISILLNKELSSIKIGYDITCVVLSVLLGLLFLQKIKGLGIATIASAIFVGKAIHWIQPVLNPFFGKKIQ